MHLLRYVFLFRESSIQQAKEKKREKKSNNNNNNNKARERRRLHRLGLEQDNLQLSTLDLSKGHTYTNEREKQFKGKRELQRNSTTPIPLANNHKSHKPLLSPCAPQHLHHQNQRPLMKKKRLKTREKPNVSQGFEPHFKPNVFVTQHRAPLSLFPLLSLSHTHKQTHTHSLSICRQ